jgi:hypothetical protein
VDCLTCGFQRSFQLLIEGDVVGSFHQFPATIPFLLCILFLIAHLIWNFRFGPKVIVGLFGSTALLVVINYVIKIANGTISHLA